MEIKNTLCNAEWELPVTLDEIRRKATDDKFKKDMIDRIKHQNLQKIDMYSICNNIIMHGDTHVTPVENPQRIPCRTSGNCKDKKPGKELWSLDKDGQGHRELGKVL